jgi:hypothetical protein
LSKDTGVKSIKIKKSVASLKIVPRGKSSSDHVQSHANFTSNRSNVRSQDNNLADEPVNPPVVAASVGTTSAISPVPEQHGMLLRVRKRATNNRRDRAISPTSKKLNRKIFKGLVSPMDKEIIVAAIEYIDDDKMGSQEVYCVDYKLTFKKCTTKMPTKKAMTGFFAGLFVGVNEV